MAKFITFDGTTFHNTNKIDTIVFKELQESIKTKDGMKYYVSFEIRIDGELIYESLDYKLSDCGYDTPNGMKNYNEAINSHRDIVLKD